MWLRQRVGDRKEGKGEEEQRTWSVEGLGKNAVESTGTQAGVGESTMDAGGKKEAKWSAAPKELLVGARQTTRQHQPLSRFSFTSRSLPGSDIVVVRQVGSRENRKNR